MFCPEFHETSSVGWSPTQNSERGAELCFEGCEVELNWLSTCSHSRRRLKRCDFRLTPSNPWPRESISNIMKVLQMSIVVLFVQCSYHSLLFCYCCTLLTRFPCFDPNRREGYLGAQLAAVASCACLIAPVKLAWSIGMTMSMHVWRLVHFTRVAWRTCFVWLKKRKNLFLGEDYVVPS